MEPTAADCSQFMTDLLRVVDLFRDALSESQLEEYWHVLQPKVSLEEWHYACEAVKERERFPRVPLPSIFLTYALEYRAQWAKFERDIQQAQRTAHGLPARDTSQDPLSQAEVQAILDRLWPGGLLPRMPAATSDEIETDDGTRLYHSGRTPQEEQARKALLRAQLDRSREPPEEAPEQAPPLPAEGGHA